MNNPGRVCALLATLWAADGANCQDLLGAAVTRTWLGNYTMNFRLDLYVDPANEVERPTIMFDSGFSTDTLFLWSETTLSGNLKLITYVNNYWFVGPGVYQPHFTIANRIAGVSNILNSDTSPIEFPSEFILTQSGWSGPNFGTPQLNATQTGSGAILTPSVSDPDGDSLVFSLVPCYGEGYFIPEGTTIDPNTGLITTNPPVPGLYAFCTKIEKIRQGVVLSTSQTDMTIRVDQVAGIPAQAPSGPMGLIPSVIMAGEPAHVCCPGFCELTISDALGRIEFRQLVADRGMFDCSHLFPGAYLYTLVDRENGLRKGGKLVVY